MTATITDLAEFKARKAGSPLRSWSDAKLQSRYKVLTLIENGASFLTDPTNLLVQRNFPEGFNPELHPTENIDAVRAEATSRGVTLT